MMSDRNTGAGRGLFSPLGIRIDGVHLRSQLKQSDECIDIILARGTVCVWGDTKTDHSSIFSLH